MSSQLCARALRIFGPGLGHTPRIRISRGVAITSCLTQTTVEIFNALAAGMLHLYGVDGLQACLRLMHLCEVNPDCHTQALLESYLINAEGSS